MKVKHLIIFVYSIFVSTFVSLNADAKYCNSQGSKAPKGTYCKALTVFDCEKGCYCTGGGNFTWAAGDVAKGCSNRWSKVTTELNNKGVYLCPAEYPDSEKGATAKTDCYKKCNDGEVVYNKKKSCSSGYYRPKGTNACVACPDDGKSICQTNSSGYTAQFTPTCGGVNSDQGIKTCDNNKGKVPNNTRTACVDKQCGAGEELKDGKCVTTKIHCIPGTYLPANSESCAACPSGKVCLGGDFDKQPIDQGADGTCDGNNIINSKGTCTPCPDGTAPNENHTVCSEAAIHVEPGYYLPANKITPTKCSGARKYCPGGDYKKGITDVGIFECPFNGRANDEGTACNVTITTEQMQYGPAGKNAPLESQCWLRTDPDDYRTCIFGTRFDVSTDK